MNKKPVSGKLINSILTLMLLVGIIVLLTFLWLRAYFGSQLDVESVIHTLAMPMTGTDKGVFYSFFKLALPVLPSGFLLAYAYYRLLAICSHFLNGGALSTIPPARLFGRLNRRFSNIIGKRPGIFYAILATVSLFLFFGAFSYIESQKRLISFFLKGRDETALFVDYYQKIQPNKVPFEEKRNVVVLLLESIENTFADSALFGENLMPNLDRLRQENLSFEGFHNTRGANWTMGALTSFFLGTPLTSTSPKIIDSFLDQSTEHFMPNASSILSIFEEHGYDIFCFFGSDARFSGKNILFRTHSNAVIFDFNYFSDEIAQNGDWPDNARSRWGVADSIVYEKAKNFLMGHDHSRPFMLVLETADTHLPSGHLNGLIHPKWGDMRDCVVEADIMAGDFVTWLLSQDFAESTTIIVTGDHLFPLGQLGNVQLPPNGKREIYNIIVNPAITLETLKPKRHFANFDMAPTILEAAGARLPNGGLGLGRSLFRDDLKTIFEERGVDWYNEEIRKKSPYYESFSE